MKQPIENRLNQDSLRRLYPLPEGFAQRTQHTLQTLSTQKEMPVKRKLSFALVFLLLILLAFGGYALSQWGVLDFLFQTPSKEQVEQLTPLTQELNIRKSVDNISLHINSVFYDGESFALDWTIQNQQPKEPRYVEITKYEVGAQRIWSDGNDSFDSQWLPGYFSKDGTMRDGEYTQLPLEKLYGDRQQVNMELSVYTPAKPLFYLEENEREMNEEEQLAWQAKQNMAGKRKLEEGYIVMDADMFFVPYPPDEHNDTGFARVIGPLPSILQEGDYTVNTLSLSFELDLSAARQARKALTPREAYPFDFMTTRYTKAVQTPAGIYLSMLIKPLPGKEALFEQMDSQGQWAISDGEGSKIDIWPLNYEGHGYDFPDGAFGRQYTIALPIPKQQVPEEISLTFYPADGAPYISPIKTK